MTKKRPRVLCPRASWSDERLVRACLEGSEEAWEAILGKYKNLVYSIPMKYGFAPEDASDVFQSVWLDLVKELPRLREPKALSGWLIKVTAHKCFRWRRRESRYLHDELDDRPEPDEAPRLDELLEQVEREQAVREAIVSLSERCRQLVRMLFFEFPPVPYARVAEKLGLARGSIGFIRGRCLGKLRRRLEERGLEG